MDNNPESAGRGLRATVIAVSLGIAVVLFWGIKGAFTKGAAEAGDADPARKSSFSPITNNQVAQRADRIPAKEPQPKPPTERQPEVNRPSMPTPKIVAPTNTSPSEHAIITASAEVASVQGSGAATTFGLLSGTVTLSGTPEPEKPLPLDPGCGKLHSNTKPTTQFYVVSSNGGLADVFVHIIKGIENRTFLPPDKPVVLDQVGCIYVPYVAGAQTGQKIEVRNSDSLMHNVHPTPVVKGNPEHNKVQMAKGLPLVFSWDQPEVFLRIKCDVHPWMFSYIGLVDHPYFTVTDTNGNYAIPNLPPGKYTIEFYHRRAGKVSHDISVEAGANTVLNGHFEISK